MGERLIQRGRDDSTTNAPTAGSTEIVAVVGKSKSAKGR